MTAKEIVDYLYKTDLETWGAAHKKCDCIECNCADGKARENDPMNIRSSGFSWICPAHGYKRL